MISEYTQILFDFAAIPRHKRNRTFMEISGYPHFENVCSNILQFYLNPNNEHGLQDLVLNSLLSLIPGDFNAHHEFETIEIRREHETKAGNRLDLLILTRNYVIGIENKIFHYLHNDLHDYYDTVCSYKTETREPKCVVLSLYKLTCKEDLKKIEDNHFVNLTYEELFNKIKESIGKYITDSNITYVNYLIEFIKSIENLTPKTMEDKQLWNFFKHNSNKIEELIVEFNKYKESLYQKINYLKGAIPQQTFAPTADEQRIWKGACLVHDYTITANNTKYNISVDAFIDFNGWQIHLFGRNNPSSYFLKDVMCKDNDFLPKPFGSYKFTKDERLIYKKFEIDTDISEIAKTLTDLLSRIEHYKKSRTRV